MQCIKQITLYSKRNTFQLNYAYLPLLNFKVCKCKFYNIWSRYMYMQATSHLRICFFLLRRNFIKNFSFKQTIYFLTKYTYKASKTFLNTWKKIINFRISKGLILIWFYYATVLVNLILIVLDEHIGSIG